MRRFLVTGVGHSGTGWAARLLTELGFPCSHEQVFTRAQSIGAWPDGTGDSSWLAVPHLAFIEPDIPVIHVVREPFDVVNSFLRIGAMGNVHRPYARFVERHRPEIIMPALAVDRVIRHVARWDEPVFNRADVTLRCGAGVDEQVETLAAIAYQLGEPPPTRDMVVAALETVGDRANHHAGDPDREWAPHALLMRPDGPELQQRRTRLGFPLEVTA